MSTSVCWELTCDGLVSCPGGVKDSHLFNTTETGDTCKPEGRGIIIIIKCAHQIINLTDKMIHTISLLW